MGRENNTAASAYAFMTYDVSPDSLISNELAGL